MRHQRGNRVTEISAPGFALLNPIILEAANP